MDAVEEEVIRPEQSKLSPGLVKRMRYLAEGFPALFRASNINVPFGFGEDQGPITDKMCISEGLEDTWLKDPVQEGKVVADWESEADNFPTSAKIYNWMPKQLKESLGNYPQGVPFVFEDPKVKKLLAPGSLSAKNKIFLTNPFTQRDISATPQESKLIAMERLHRRELGEILGLKVLLKETFDRVQRTLKMAGSPDPPVIDWADEFELISEMLYLCNSTVVRTKYINCSNLMLMRSSLRTSVLDRCFGKVDTKSALKVSNFGSPNLFGLVTDDIAEKIKINNFDYKAWQIKVPGPKRPSDFATPYGRPAKRIATGAVAVSDAVVAWKNAPKRGSGRGKKGNQSFRGARGGQRGVGPISSKKKGG